MTTAKPQKRVGKALVSSERTTSKQKTKSAGLPLHPSATPSAKARTKISARDSASSVPPVSPRRRSARTPSAAHAAAQAEALDQLQRYVQSLALATPEQLMQFEREGVSGDLLKSMAIRLHVSTTRLYHMIGVAKATAEQKLSKHQPIIGASGHAAVGIARLLGRVDAILTNSTSKQALDFDGGHWLGRWLENPQPALGGRRPGDLLDTPTGFEVVSRSLGAIESGAYL